MNLSPEQIFEEYTLAQRYKSSIGDRGLLEQAKINERFYIGDQWYGANCGNDRPLVRHNVIKRIGDYKMSALLSGKIDIYYSAEGVPTLPAADSKILRKKLAQKPIPFTGDKTDEEISIVMAALSDYQKTTAERLKFGNLAAAALKNAFISGTGIIYTYWDDSISTGLYADDKRSVPIMGDIASECLSVENVCFGDNTEENLQKQPFIIIATLRETAEVIRMAEKYGVKNISEIKEAELDGKITVLTKLFKEYDKNGNALVYAVQVAKNTTIREKWCLNIGRYPLAKFCWEENRGSAYGSSEITYLIPNQIAVNRMVTAKVWSALANGMPLMLVNGDMVDGEITNDPGQIIKVFGSSEDVAGAIRFVSPADTGPAYDDIIGPIIDNTLSQSGANAAALGDVNPDNNSAIMQLRNAAKLPLTLLQNRYFEFLEEVSRIWSEFWVKVYGNRLIKQTDGEATWYMVFDGKRYEDLILNATAELSLAEGYTAESATQILDKLYNNGAISAAQYLKRLPKGLINDVAELIKDAEERKNDELKRNL